MEMKIKNLWDAYQDNLKALGRKYDSLYENSIDPDEILKINTWYRRKKKMIENQFVLTFGTIGA